MRTRYRYDICVLCAFVYSFRYIRIIVDIVTLPTCPYFNWFPFFSLLCFILSRSLILSRSFFRWSAVMRRRFNTINMLTVLLATKARQPTQPDEHTLTHTHAHPRRHLATGARWPPPLKPPSTAWQHCFIFFFLGTNETMSTKIPKQKTPKREQSRQTSRARHQIRMRARASGRARESANTQQPEQESELQREQRSHCVERALLIKRGVVPHTTGSLKWANEASRREQRTKLGTAEQSSGSRTKWTNSTKHDETIWRVRNNNNSSISSAATTTKHCVVNLFIVCGSPRVNLQRESLESSAKKGSKRQF